MEVVDTVTAKQQVNVKVDLVEGWINKTDIVFKQADHKTRYFMVRVSNILPINIEGCIPTLFFKQPNGDTYNVAGKIVLPERGEFMVELTATLLKEIGITNCEIALLKDGETILSFPHFQFRVIESIHSGDSNIITDEEVGIFWGIIAQANEGLIRLDNDYGVFEQSKDNEFTTFLQEKEAQYIQTESVRQASEQGRVTAEKARQTGYTEMQSKINEVYSTTLKYRIVEV